MYRILTCLTVEHDWRLVVLAAGVCFLASGVAISLFHRAQVVTGRERLVWLSLDAAAAGFGIWATHFIAMLAYDPGIGAGYNVTLTVLSLLVAILITGAGLAIALGDFSHKAVTAVGGAVVGSGVAAMHYSRHGGVGGTGSHHMVAGPCCSVYRAWHRVGRLRALRCGATRREGSHVDRDRSADACHCFHALHSHERRAAGAGPNTRNQFAVLVTDFSFSSRRRRSGHYSRHVLCCGNWRSPLEGQTAAAEASARRSPREYVSRALHVRA